MDPYDNDNDKPHEDPYGDMSYDSNEDRPAPQQGDDAGLPQPTPLGTPAPTSLAQAPAPQVYAIESDMLCIACGYNLRGQTTQSTCPECGMPVERSLRTDQLSGANPAWLGGLKTGMTWLLIGCAVTVINMIIAMAIGVAMTQSMQGPSPMTQQPMALLIFSVISNLVLSGIVGYAIYLLTQPEPAAPAQRVTRPIARWTIIPAYGVSIFASFIALGQSPAAEAASGIISVVSFLLFLVGFPCFMLYLRSLALRIPNKGLATQTSVVLYGILSSVALMIPLAVVMGFAVWGIIGSMGGPGGSQNPSAGSTAAGAMAIVGILSCLMLVAWLVFGIWWIVLMCLYRGQFGQVFDAAQHGGR